MKTHIIWIEGCPLVTPKGYTPKYGKLNDFPNCCGAGEGFGEKIIPETSYGLRISAACQIHDISWEEAEATWEAFHQTNAMFLLNTLSIIRGKSANKLTRSVRNYRAMTYYVAVEEAGPKGFWDLKVEQGKIKPEESPFYKEKKDNIDGYGDIY